jgi:hypothetical protein
MAEMQTCLPVADERSVRYHSEGDRGAVRKFEIDNLIICNVVVGLVDTYTIRARLESFGNVLNIWNTIYDGTDGPTRVTTGYAIEIN